MATLDEVMTTERDRLIELDRTLDGAIAWLLSLPHSDNNTELVMSFVHARTVIRRAREDGL